MWMGLAFSSFSVRVCLVERTVLGSGCLIGLCKDDPFLLQKNLGVEHTCLPLWMREDKIVLLKWGG